MKTYANTPKRIKAILTSEEFHPIPVFSLTKIEYKYHQWWYRVLFHATPIYTHAKFQKNRKKFLREEK